MTRILVGHVVASSLFADVPTHQDKGSGTSDSIIEALDQVIGR